MPPIVAEPVNQFWCVAVVGIFEEGHYPLEHVDNCFVTGELLVVVPLEYCFLEYLADLEPQQVAEYLPEVVAVSEYLKCLLVDVIHLISSEIFQLVQTVLCDLASLLCSLKMLEWSPLDTVLHRLNDNLHAKKREHNEDVVEVGVVCPLDALGELGRTPAPAYLYLYDVPDYAEYGHLFPSFV